MHNIIVITLILLGTCLTTLAEPTWIEKSEGTRSLIYKMDSYINSPDRNRGFDLYMSIFAKDLKAYGLIESGPADLSIVKHHYKPVFAFFEDGSLVTETLVVAGNMAAQRYHSLFKLNGTFDGVSYKDKPMAIRGITFFQFNEKLILSYSWLMILILMDINDNHFLT